jgi:hypothetical protein
MYQKLVPFLCSQVVVYFLNPSEASLRFPEHKFSSNLEDMVTLFVWVITYDLSGLGDPASSYATAGLALRVI